MVSVTVLLVLVTQHQDVFVCPALKSSVLLRVNVCAHDAIFLPLQETYLMKHMSKHTVVEHLVTQHSPPRNESPSIPIRISLI